MYIICLYDEDDIIDCAYGNKVFKTKQDLAKYVVLDDFLLGLRDNEEMGIKMGIIELEINK